MSANRYTFDNFTSYLSACREPRKPGCGMHSETNRDSWAGCSLSEAFKLAETGWQDGRKKVEAISTEILKRIASKVHRPITTFDVAGDALEIGRFVTGEPECFMTFEENEVETSGHKIIKMRVSRSVSSAVPAEVIETRGAAIVALIEALEASDYRVEVWVDMSLTTGFGGGNNLVEYLVNIKEASAPLQIDQLAYALIHPAFFRRLHFRLMEASDNSEVVARTTDGGYGWPADSSEPADIVLGKMHSGEYNWASVENASQWVLDTLQQQGVRLND